MTVLFRLAFLLHRNRHTLCPEFRLELDERNIGLHFSDEWLKQAPLTDADLQQEAEYLKDAGFNMSLVRCTPR